ncbi:MAG: hypothetical protein Q4B22_06095 [Eubacteriales bacterium]|nr:hypothetical protein [Eubacteriales bacterium]
MKKRSKIHGLYYILGTTAVALLFMHFPFIWQEFEGNGNRFFKTLFVSINNTIGVFTIDSGYENFFQAVNELPGRWFSVYQGWAAILFLLAPCLTLGILLSFAKTLRMWFRYLVSCSKEEYIFSELNERSVLLAQSLAKNKNDRKILFANVDFEDLNQEKMIAEVKGFGGLLFSRGIAELSLKKESKTKSLTFFLMGEEQSVLEQSIQLVKKYGKRKNTTLYMFADSKESELLVSSMDTEQMDMVIHRVDAANAFVMRYLYENGHEVFAGADMNGSIRCAVIGLGKVGRELVKNLSWYGQMPGYSIQISGYDAEQNTLDALYGQCPELLDDRYNGTFIEGGEAEYKISLHLLKSLTSELAAKQAAESDPTIVYIDMGKDACTIEMAEAVRRELLRLGQKPMIAAVVRDSDKNRLLQDLHNWKNQYYEISFMGSDESIYNEDSILHSRLEKEAMDLHLRYCDLNDADDRLKQERMFWRYEYNYRSSLASAIHRKARKECGIPGTDKPAEQRTEEEKKNIRIMEHKRWNAYIRSIGYCYAEQRNDLAQTHHFLVPFDKLPLKEQIKDDI